VAKKYQWNTLTAIGGTMIEVRDGYALAELPLSQEVMQPTQVFMLAPLWFWQMKQPQLQLMAAP
jgi:hypothetical protein